MESTKGNEDVTPFAMVYTIQ